MKAQIVQEAAREIGGSDPPASPGGAPGGDARRRRNERDKDVLACPACSRVRILVSSYATCCAHCLAGEPSVWDNVLFHYAHPAGSKLKLCYDPWRERCRCCSADPGECSCANT